MTNQNHSSPEMGKTFHYRVNFPSDLDYIPAVRQFLSDLAKIEGFGEKACFRTEIMVDELCNNAIMHGAQDINSDIDILTQVNEKEINIIVRDQGGSTSNVERLKSTLTQMPKRSENQSRRGRGLEIVQMLSDQIKVQVENQGFTEIRVSKARTEEALRFSRSTGKPQ